jgi:hypothetical protein
MKNHEMKIQEMKNILHEKNDKISTIEKEMDEMNLIWKENQ